MTLSTLLSGMAMKYRQKRWEYATFVYNLLCLPRKKSMRDPLNWIYPENELKTFHEYALRRSTSVVDCVIRHWSLDIGMVSLPVHVVNTL